MMATLQAQLIMHVKSFVVDNLSGFQLSAIPNFIFNLLLAGFLAHVLGIVYIRYARSLSNKRAFARNFLNLAIATMFVITIVKSSLALSLGLVGALSIVRFRSAIKEPEELTYLFLAIAIGLGCGAGYSILTALAFALIFVVLRLTSKDSENDSQHLYLSLQSKHPDRLKLDVLADTLSKHCRAVRLKRTDESADRFEASFVLDCENFEKLQQLKADIRALDSEVTMSYLDTSREI